MTKGRAVCIPAPNRQPHAPDFLEHGRWLGQVGTAVKTSWYLKRSGFALSGTNALTSTSTLTCTCMACTCTRTTLHLAMTTTFEAPDGQRLQQVTLRVPFRAVSRVMVSYT